MQDNADVELLGYGVLCMFIAPILTMVSICLLKAEPTPVMDIDPETVIEETVKPKTAEQIFLESLELKFSELESLAHRNSDRIDELERKSRSELRQRKQALLDSADPDNCELTDGSIVCAVIE